MLVIRTKSIIIVFYWGDEMAKRKELTATVSVIMEDGTVKPFEELTAEEEKRLRENIRKRLEKSMSLYYSNHPEEFAKLK